MSSDETRDKDIVEEKVEDCEEVERDEEVKDREPETTTFKKKDPRRVEQGKRLAMISKEAKERKMRSRIEAENFSYMKSYGYPLITLVSVLGVTWMMVFGSPLVGDEKPTDIVTEKEPKKTVKSTRFENLG